MKTDGTPQVKTVTVQTGLCCCGTKTEEDAIEYYSSNVEKLKMEINKEYELQS